MKKMVVGLLAALMFSLCACGGTKEETKAERESVKKVEEETKETSAEEELKQRLVEHDWMYEYRYYAVYSFEENGTYKIANYRPEDMAYLPDDFLTASWAPDAKDLEEDVVKGRWKIDGGSVILTDKDTGKEWILDLYRKDSGMYAEKMHKENGPEYLLYETDYVEPEEYTGPAAALMLYQTEKRTETAATAETVGPSDHRGVYYLDDGYEGSYYIVKNVSETEVSGQLIYGVEFDGGREYDIRDFSWEVSPDDPNRMQESIYGGTDYIYYSFNGDELKVDYPDGIVGSPDEYYQYVCPVEELHDKVKHSVFDSQSEPETAADVTEDADSNQPFWGIWVAASKDYETSAYYVEELKAKGFHAEVYETTDWSNLNPEHWYVVSAGEYTSEGEAENAMDLVHQSGFGDAYIKYTGDWIR